MQLLNNVKKVHFIGIGGVSMSGLAAVLSDKGYEVTGSDGKAQDSTKRLIDRGISVRIGHCDKNLPEGTDLVVRTAAVRDNNPELEAARRMGIRSVSRAELLGELVSGYQRSVAITGTHGKTTTTAMVSAILKERDPSVLVGGYLSQIGGNYRIGKGDTIVFEADEYSDSFLSFYPTSAAVLNLEADHPDYFKDIHHLRRSFSAFVANVRDWIAVNKGIDGRSEVIKGIRGMCKTVTFSTCEKADFYVENIDFNAKGHSSFDIIAQGERVVRVSTGLTGMHNIENAVAAFAVCACSFDDFSFEAAAEALSVFEPCARRFEIKGVCNGATIADDYAHHPTEIRRALEGAEKTNHKRVVCLFQPHTYSRTHKYFDDFADALQSADEIGLLDIFAAREENTYGVTSKELASAIRKKGKKAEYFTSFEEAVGYYENKLDEGDLLITMGAGDVYKVGEILVAASKQGG